MRNDGTTRETTNVQLATALCVLSFGLVLFLLRPGSAAMGSVSAANLYISIPFVFLAIFCFQLVLEGSGSEIDLEAGTGTRTETEFDDPDGRNRT